MLFRACFVCLDEQKRRRPASREAGLPSGPARGFPHFVPNGVQGAPIPRTRPPHSPLIKHSQLGGERTLSRAIAFSRRLSPTKPPLPHLFRLSKSLNRNKLREEPTLERREVPEATSFFPGNGSDLAGKGSVCRTHTHTLSLPVPRGDPVLVLRSERLPEAQLGREDGSPRLPARPVGTFRDSSGDAGGILWGPPRRAKERAIVPGRRCLRPRNLSELRTGWGGDRL